LPPKKLLVGLGNPGAKYARTRHNAGFLVVEAFVARHGGSFRAAPLLGGRLAELTLGESAIWVFEPSGYMNVSGAPVARCLKRAALPPLSMLVVHDEVELPFGTLRTKPGGGTGGHNGLRSIEAALQTRDYPRLRVGVGRPEEESGDLADYVLEEFSPAEREKFPQLWIEACEMIESWVSNEVTSE